MSALLATFALRLEANAYAAERSKFSVANLGILPIEDCRAIAHALRAFNTLPSSPAATIEAGKFAVGDRVLKHTGDYQIVGEVRAVFTMRNGAVRYVVEHKAEGGGSFCHIYSAANLRPATAEA